MEAFREADTQHSEKLPHPNGGKLGKNQELPNSRHSPSIPEMENPWCWKACTV